MTKITVDRSLLEQALGTLCRVEEYGSPTLLVGANVRRSRDAILSALDQPCKYGQNPSACTSQPMDCQCALDAAAAQ